MCIHQRLDDPDGRFKVQLVHGLVQQGQVVTAQLRQQCRAQAPEERAGLEVLLLQEPTELSDLG